MDALLIENARLRSRVEELEKKLELCASSCSSTASSVCSSPSLSSSSSSNVSQYWSHTLSADKILRYSRQMLIPELGAPAQMQFQSCRVLVVGAGGLGAPVLLYLTAAGIGCLGIVDSDFVELNNLHRQVIHPESSVGVAKALSAAAACKKLNSSISITPYVTSFNETNALDLVKGYDIVVDCTDNVATRYLINDACVLSGRCVVSGSALRLEGQVTVYGYQGGPCYRCLFPEPPPAESVTNCSDGGVLGVVTGIIGSIQAMEVLRIAASMNFAKTTTVSSSSLSVSISTCASSSSSSLSSSSSVSSFSLSSSSSSVSVSVSSPPSFGSTVNLSQKLFLYDGLLNRFRVVRLRSRNPNCAVCGDKPTIRSIINYKQFCHQTALNDHFLFSTSSSSLTSSSMSSSEKDKKEEKSFSVTVDELYNTRKNSQLHVLLDVRETHQFQICCLPKSLNIPRRDLVTRIQDLKQHLTQTLNTSSSSTRIPVFVICRRGVDSVRASSLLRDLQQKDSFFAEKISFIHNVEGGLLSWSKRIDSTFPIY
eukprot:TRINITY_DN364_c1_g4_i1.p1 TRINITY_DN364_c1_g4~~TRINITY_DN364_c1_g4_i1.p1  ORF type:complete len:539 (+),score=96.55 TRINITY_DN364_c1_g4_i1:120-1736(+)